MSSTRKNLDTIPVDSGLPLALTVRQRARVIRSYGQQMLLDIDLSLAQIAERLGPDISRQSVSQWRNGNVTPDDARRHALQRAFGIPFEAWGARGGVGPPPPRADRPPPPRPVIPDPDPPGAPPLPDPAEESADDSSGPVSVLDDYDALLKVLRSQLRVNTLTPRERAQLTDAMTRAVTQKSRVEAQRAMLEADTVRMHPKWRAMKALIIDALIPFPDAARAVEQAIQKALGEEQEGQT